MFRKFNLKKLSIIFAALLIVFVVTRLIDSSKGVNTLKAYLFEVDANDITSVIIEPKVLNGKQIELKKEGEEWKVLKDGKSYNGDANLINNLISQVNKLKPRRLAARNKDKWEKFELTDSLSSLVTLMGGSEELASLYIGKFSYLQAKQNPMMQQNPYYQRPGGTMTTYVRTGDEKEVYAVEGFLGSMINRDVDAFRNKQIVKTTKQDINKITFTYPSDSSFTMVKNEDKWMSNGMELDSVSVDKYLNSIRSLNGSSFTDENPGSFDYSVSIQDNKMKITEIKAALNADEAIITTSQNQGSIFKEKKDRNFDKLFISKVSLLQ